MKLHTAGEDYLEAVLILQKKLGMVRSVVLLGTWRFQNPAFVRSRNLYERAAFLTTDENHYLHLTDLGQEVAGKNLRAPLLF